MAKTYYGYKRREGLKPIDYLGAAKDLTAGLTGIFEEREKEREVIEEEVRKAEEEAKDVPMGDSSTLNEMVIDSSNGAAEALRIQAQLMRNGIIRPSEYTKFKQNTLDGVKDLKEGAASLNKNITDAKAAIDAGTASVSTMTFMEDAMKNTWFDRTRMYTDPKTGHLMIVRTDEKGKDIGGSETTMRNFKNQTKQIINRYDVEKETSSFTKTLGEDVRLALKDPNIKTIKDALQKTTIDPQTGEVYTNFELIDQWVESITDADAASILVDELGGEYSATGDVNEKGKVGKVYYKIDPTAANKNTRTADLTDEQRKAAKEYLKRNIYAQLDYVETPEATTSGTAPSSAQIQAGKARDEAVVSINTLADWYGAKTPEDRRTAAAGLAASLGTNFISLVPSPDGKTATLTSIQKVSGKDVQVDTEIDIEGVPFDQFIKSFGKALTGQDLSQYYSDFVASGRTVNLEPFDPDIDYPAGAYKKTFKQPPKDLSQELADVGEWRTNVVKTVDDIKVSEGFFGVSDEKVNESFETAITENLFASGISDYDVLREGNNITIKVDGLGEISVAVGRKDTDKAKVKKILSDVYTRVSKGEMIDGSGKPENKAGDPKGGTPPPPAGFPIVGSKEDLDKLASGTEYVTFVPSENKWSKQTKGGSGNPNQAP